MSTVQLRYNFRSYPTPGQQQALARAFGCARVVYNDGLRIRQEAHAAGLPYIKDADLQRQVLTEAKKTPERVWLADVSNVVLVQSLNDLHKAFRAFFASATGKRKGPKVGPPRFTSRKDSRQAIRFTRNGFSLRPNGRLYLAKIGDVAVRWSRRLPSEPSSVTVVKDAAGRYFASFVVEVPGEPLPETTSEAGIDLGLTHFAVLSDGRNTRRDWAHKLSTALIRENQAIYVEDLAVSGLARTRLAKSVHDAGWSQFVAMLEYKAAPAWAHLRQGGPLVPQLEDMLRLRGTTRRNAAERSRVGVRLWRYP